MYKDLKMKLFQLLFLSLIIVSIPIKSLEPHLAVVMAGQVAGAALHHIHTQYEPPALITVNVPEPLHNQAGATIDISWNHIGHIVTITSSTAAALFLWNKNGTLPKEALHLSLLYGVPPACSYLYRRFIRADNVFKNFLIGILPFVAAETIKKQEILTRLYEGIYKPLLTP